MLNRPNDVTTVVHETVNEILEEEGSGRIEFAGTERLIDIGFTSLLLARLVIQLESEIRVDPFEETFVISDVQTVGDLIDAYQKSLDVAVAG